MKKIKILIKLMRVKHYIKNLLIFMPLIFTHGLFTKNFISVLYGFIAFSLMASVVYIINDIVDKNKDKLHNTKKHRPIASGEISVDAAVLVCVILFFLSLYINYLSKANDLFTPLLLLLYLISNIIYSLYVKNLPIFDVFFLVCFYILRIYYGAQIIDVRVSYWLYLTIMSGAFFLSLGKRRNEIRDYSKTRKVLNKYNEGFLDKFMYVSVTSTFLFYSLWAVNQNLRFLVFTIPVVFIIMIKYLLLIEKESDGDPTEVLLKDKTLVVLCLIYGVMLIYIMR